MNQSRPFHLVLILLTFICSLAASVAFAGDAKIVIDVDHPAHQVSPTFYGLMTEEINHSYEGGLYGELIQNRSLLDNPKTPVHWSAYNGANISLDHTNPVNNVLTASLKCVTPALGCVRNDGYWGIPYKPGQVYQLTFYARSDSAKPIKLYAGIVSANAAYGSSRASSLPIKISDHWAKYSVNIVANHMEKASAANVFQIFTDSKCTFWLSSVSLFPPTFHNRPNGNRSDLMTMLAGMHPSFLRLPGGNYLEGNTLADYFPWKKTLGDISQRPGHRGPWGYGSNDGMGLLEFLDWCEDLKMQPVLAVYAGYALNGTHIAPGKDLSPFVQDALDEVEYVNGPASSKWGAVRAKNGHPTPFPLTYVEVGNEDWFDPQHTYDQRFAQFYDAIHAKYPKLKIIATTHVSSRTPDVYDDHYYRSAAGNERDASHYDSAPRTGPKIFVGEWASTEGAPTPNLRAALGDAAWLTGLERNSDLVVMEAYAPLLVRVEPGASQWGTNLIGYDALHSFGSPSYYVQSVFAANTGSEELPVKIDQPVLSAAPEAPVSGGIGIGTWDTQSQFKDITVTSGDKTLYASNLTQGDSDWTFSLGKWSLADGVLTQTSDARASLAYIPNDAWKDYTLHLQARKLSGSEGFLIIVHRKSDQDFVQFNFGGWGNSRTTIQRMYPGGDSREIAPSFPQKVRANRWYDIKVDVKGSHIACYVDGKEYSSADDFPDPDPVPLFCSASSSSNGKVYVKVVNVTGSPITCDLALKSAAGMNPSVGSVVISGDPLDQNTIKLPNKILPEYSVISTPSNTQIKHIFPAHSVTVLVFKKHVHQQVYK